jgi:hypothetical protein
MSEGWPPLFRIVLALAGAWWFAGQVRRAFDRKGKASRLERSQVWLVLLAVAFLVAFLLADWLGLSLAVATALVVLACASGAAAAVVSFVIGWKGDR